MQTIKTGNPFTILFIVRDCKTREPIEITNEMQFSSKIVNSINREIAMCEVKICDQMVIKGGVILKVNQEITRAWKPGVAKGDIKFTLNGMEKNSENYSFMIEKGIT